MFRNYFIVAWRNLLRNKIYTTINILGLTIGVTSCLVLYLIVNYELSFNKKIKDYDRIFRVHSSFSGNMAALNRGVPTALAQAIRDQFTGVASVTLGTEYQSKVKLQSTTGKKELDHQNTLFTDPSYFNVFESYEWIAGSPEVLSKPFQVVITESKAKLYFNTSDPATVIGKEIIYLDSLSTNVAGIVKDLGFTTDLDFTDFISIETIRLSFVKQSTQLDDWRGSTSSTFTFFKTSPGTPKTKMDDQLKVLEQLCAKARKSEDGVKTNFKLDRLANLHFNSQVGIFDHSREPAHLPTLYVLIGVSFVLLLIAAINFINIETARAATRSKEVGVRKVLGSQRYHLIFQFLTESTLVTLVAVVLAIPLSALSFVYFAEFIPTGLTINYPGIIPFLFTVVVIVGLIAGLYPGLVLSSFKPVLALKTKNYLAVSKTRSIPIRKALIVFQFTVAQIFICATLIFSSQIHYLLNKDLGFRSDAVIYFYAPWREKDHNKKEVLKNELNKIPEIKEFCMSAQPPTFYGWSSSTFSLKGGDGSHIEAFRKFGDPEYLKFYRIKLLAGKNVEPSDTIKEFIINETMMRQLGLVSPNEAIGREIFGTNGKQPLPIVGVVKDFNTQSLHSKISPVIIANEKRNLSCFNLKLSTENQHSAELQLALSKIEAAWKGVYPDYTIDYEFLDQTIRDFYQSEQRNSALVNTATALAVLISCLGLFGLASYTTIQRTKEIGIRKVLGASVSNIIALLSREFITLVIIGFFVAIPLSWYASNYWLESYPYHIAVGAHIFIMTLLVALLIAIGSVSYQTFRAANSNPTDSLKSE